MSQLFTSGGQSIGVPASTSVLPMNTQDWLDLLAVQETLKSLLQHHSSKASILRDSAFFIVQLSHPYMAIGKTIAFTRQSFVSKTYLYALYLKYPMREVLNCYASISLHIARLDVARLFS